MKYLVILCIINLFLFLLFNYINIFLKKDIRLTRVYKIILFASALIIAYSTIPNELDDLSRYFVHLDNFSAYGLSYITDFPYKENIVVTLLFYFISIIGNNHLLPVIVVAIYSLSVSLLLKKGNIENDGYLMSIIIIILFSFEYLNIIISGVRFPLATAVFVIIFLYDENNNKKYNILYIIPLMIHSSYLLMLGLVFLTKLQIKSKIDFKKWIIIIPYFAILVAVIFPKNIIFFSDVFNRLLIYINPLYSLQYIDIRLLICYITLFFMIVYLNYKINRINNDLIVLKKELYYYNSFFNNLLFMLLGLLPFISIFTRFFSLFLVLFIPIFSLKKKMLKNEKKILLTLLLILCLGVFAYRMVNAIHYWRFLFF